MTLYLSVVVIVYVPQAQIYALHEEVDKLYSRKSELEQELAQITHQNLLEKQLDVQVSEGLLPGIGE